MEAFISVGEVTVVGAHIKFRNNRSAFLNTLFGQFAGLDYWTGLVSRSQPVFLRCAFGESATEESGLACVHHLALRKVVLLSHVIATKRMVNVLPQVMQTNAYVCAQLPLYLLLT